MDKKEKEILYSSDARRRLKNGIDKLANAVKVTLGPKGRNVIIEDHVGNPHITKDGVTVAKAVNVIDPYEKLGVKMIKDVAAKTAFDSGDGTTTATILTQAIITEGLKHLEAGANPIELKFGIDKAVEDIVDIIKQLSIDVGLSDVKNIATISANNDNYIGGLISDALNQVGKEGIVRVEKTNKEDTTISVDKGMVIQRGYRAKEFITNQNTKQCILNNVIIVISDEKVNTTEDILDAMNYAVKTNKSLLIICNDIENEPLTNAALNNLNGAIKMCIINAPAFGENRSYLLEDIAIYTGGKVISTNKGLTIAGFSNPLNYGLAEQVIIDKHTTSIIGGQGDSNKIDNYCNSIKAAIAKDSDEQHIDFLKLRLALLLGGIATINVGAGSEVELKEKIDRIEDALCATKAAIESGMILGGGSSYIRSNIVLNENLSSMEVSDFKTGYMIVTNSILIPFKQLFINAAREDYLQILKTIKDDPEFNNGYDLKKDKYGDLYELGVIEPTKVAINALKNAASVASMFLTTECIVPNNLELNY